MGEQTPSMDSRSRVPAPRYVVISPVRDEAQYLERTIRSMLHQTVRPAQWILVNDGSSDETGQIIDRWASEQPWILGVHRSESSLHRLETANRTDKEVGGSGRDRGNRAQDAKEIKAFYEGFEKITARDWEFLVKLDGDISFVPEYFEKCFAEFDANPELGIGGGEICNLVDGEWKVEPNPRFHVRGATKIYRRACWEQMSGVPQSPGWDTVDEVKANMLGWKTRSFPELPVRHYRFTGAANGSWRNAVKNGMWSYISGYHPLYMLFRCIKQLFHAPYLTGSVGLLCGYVQGYVRRIPQIDDKDLIRYLRDQQLRRLSFRASIWT
jgi:biofilm PGA synthesis N-glycosyltransferase PgaC